MAVMFHVCVLIETLMATVLLVCSFRPGLVGADSVTGDSNHRDWLYWLIRGVVELGVFPAGNGSDEKLIDVVNVDYVAAAIVHVALNMTGKVKTHFFVNLGVWTGSNFHWKW